MGRENTMAPALRRPVRASPHVQRRTAMKMRTIVSAVSTGSLLVLAASAGAEGGRATFVEASAVKYGEAPPVLPKGAQLAVLQGDPGKAGPFVMRLKVPANYRVAPHSHSKDENLTVISGTFY